MKETQNIPPRGNLRRNRLLLVAAVVLAFLTLAFCHSQKPGTVIETFDTKTTDLESVAESNEDADGDGLSNEFDACPDIAGAAIDNGCPVDTDGDGIADMEDKCPTRAGDTDGCPEDSDKDGISDTEDTCPDIAGPVASQGCPSDSDGDGVGDAIDQCPQTAGQVSLDGCTPDSQPGDVTRDNGNKSPITDESAASDNTGNGVVSHNVKTINTEDEDGDGVQGESDKCPEQFGNAADEGCPPDTDNDGIPDIDDRCPTVAGTADTEGCLATDHSGRSKLDTLDQQILDKAVAGVAFDSNSATLTPDSRDLLTDVAGLLQKYPTATLEIRGHTDASGVADNNMQLSMARARSAAAYIVSVGIDVSRLRAFGYGESQPIADNNSPEGRRTNRRVEFELLIND